MPNVKHDLQLINVDGKFCLKATSFFYNKENFVACRSTADYRQRSRDGIRLRQMQGFLTLIGGEGFPKIH